MNANWEIASSLAARIYHPPSLVRCFRRNSWALTAALVVALLLVFFGVDTSSKAILEPLALFSSLILLAGMLLITGRQEAVLAGLIICLETWFVIGEGRDAQVISVIFLRRSLCVALCIWAAHVRCRLDQQRLVLRQSKDELQSKLVLSLQAASLIHELRQPLAAVTLQTRLALHQLEQGEPDTAALKQQLVDLAANGSRINAVTGAIQDLLRTLPAEQACRRLDLAALLRHCLNNSLESRRAAGITLEQQGLTLPHQVAGDRDLQPDQQCDRGPGEWPSRQALPTGAAAQQRSGGCAECCRQRPRPSRGSVGIVAAAELQAQGDGARPAHGAADRQSPWRPAQPGPLGCAGGGGAVPDPAGGGAVPDPAGGC